MSIAVPLHGFGTGGSSLYYSVVCSTTEPAKKEGRIWVKSGVPMTQFEVGNTWTTAKVGVVVVGGTPGGANPTSANKILDLINTKVAGIQNRLKLTPASCKQVQGSVGNWVSVDAYVCHSDTWIQFSSAWNGELYDSGNQFVAVTGGWNKCNWKSYATESISLPSVTYNADSVTISKSKSNATSGGWCTVNKIDLSGYNTIRFFITNCYMTGSEVSLFATENVEGGISSAASRVKVGSNGAKEMAIDISNVNKSCYVGIGISTYQDYDANITVSKIILE